LVSSFDTVSTFRYGLVYTTQSILARANVPMGFEIEGIQVAAFA
jgi:hypothetical protein